MVFFFADDRSQHTTTLRKGTDTPRSLVVEPLVDEVAEHGVGPKDSQCRISRTGGDSGLGDQTAEDSIEVDFAYHPCSGTDQIGEAFDLYCGGHL